MSERYLFNQEMEESGMNTRYFQENWRDFCFRHSGKIIVIHSSGNGERIVKTFDTAEQRDDYLRTLDEPTRHASYQHSSRIPGPGSPFPKPASIATPSSSFISRY